MLLKKLIIFLISLTAISNTLYSEGADVLANEIYKEVLSPFCPGRLLYDCPSSKATELKLQIKDMVVSGKQKEEIFKYLIETYGNDIKAMPDNFGFGLVGWIMPLIFFTIAGLTLIIWVKTQKSSSTS
jgi:cytochrome c-type biogenesis protein CcmH/NrfF